MLAAILVLAEMLVLAAILVLAEMLVLAAILVLAANLLLVDILVNYLIGKKMIVESIVSRCTNY